jgi:hypothetical protein
LENFLSQAAQEHFRPTTSTEADAFDAWKKELAALKATDWQNVNLPLPRYWQLQKNSMGYVESFEVVQIIDRFTFLGKFTTLNSGPTYGKQGSQGVVYPGAALKSDLVQVSGWVTEGMVDGNSYATDAAFRVVDTIQYQSVTGPRTVWRLQPIMMKTASPASGPATAK